MLTAADYDVRGATASLAATDYDVRGTVASVDPSAVVYDARQLESNSAAPSPLPFDLSALNLDSSPAPSPLPFDLSGLHIGQSAPVIGPPTESDYIAIIEATTVFDYTTLEQYAQRGHDFNLHARFIPAHERQYTNRGFVRSLASTPVLNFIVFNHPRQSNFDLNSTLQLIRWLIAHGANPDTRDRHTGSNMWNTLQTSCQLADWKPAAYPPWISANCHKLRNALVKK